MQWYEHLDQEVTDRSITDVDLATSGITDDRLAGGNGTFLKRQVGITNFRAVNALALKEG